MVQISIFGPPSFKEVIPSIDNTNLNVENLIPIPLRHDLKKIVQSTFLITSKDVIC